jgi:osmoprotectant transport system substrate-binding protein
MRSIRAALGAVLLAAELAVGACGGDENGGRGSAQPQGADLRITLGTQNFTEAIVLGELWRQALAANGYAVDLRKNMGPLEEVDEALRAGEIDGHPAYMGASLSVLAGEESAGLDAKQTYDKLKAFYAKRGQTLSSTTPFENVDAIATTQLFAQREQLRTMEDLRRLDKFTLGARPEFEERYQGLAGMQKVYGLTNAQFKPIALGAQYGALDAGDVDAVNVFTTDPQLATNDYAILEDPKRLFGSQHVAMVIDTKKLGLVGREDFLDVVADVNRRLTTRSMVEMNEAVELDGQDVGDVVARFLREEGILRGRGQ